MKLWSLHLFFVDKTRCERMAVFLLRSKCVQFWLLCAGSVRSEGFGSDVSVFGVVCFAGSIRKVSCWMCVMSETCTNRKTSTTKMAEIVVRLEE